MIMAIEVQGLTKRYGLSMVLEDVGFTATEGETSGVTGVKGAGKTGTAKGRIPGRSVAHPRQHAFWASPVAQSRCRVQ
jgi:ABC-type glutathione transport system ATPase component